MARRMSCSMTVGPVRRREKDVTRRHGASWTTLAAGDRLVLIEKGMGLPKGAHQVVLDTVEVVDVRLEPLSLVDEAECLREGFPEMSPVEFMRFWLAGHGMKQAKKLADDEVLACAERTFCRRIEWKYIYDTRPSGGHS